jgi:hypothetical protein
MILVMQSSSPSSRSLIIVVVLFGLIVLGLGALFLSAVLRSNSSASLPTAGAATQIEVQVQTSLPPGTSLAITQPPSAPTGASPGTTAPTPGAATEAAAPTGAGPQPTQPSPTNLPATSRPSATPRQSTNAQPTSASPGNTSAPNATPTLEDNPSLLLTPFTPPTAAPTPVPLPTSSSPSGAFVEVQVAQVQRIQVSGGFILMADIGNITNQPIRDVSLIFTNASGARVGEAKPLGLHLLANDARPGATNVLAATDPIIVNWGNLQARAIGAPAAAPGQAGYPIWLDITPVTISITQDGYTYQSVVTNHSGSRANIPYQNVSFFANDGTLLYVATIGARPALNDGESYILTGSVPINQTAANGRALGEYTDVLASISAEIAP